MSNHYHSTVIRRLIKANDIPTNMYCHKVTFVRVGDIKRILDSCDDPQPYGVMRSGKKLHCVREEEKGYWVIVCEGKGAKMHGHHAFPKY